MRSYKVCFWGSGKNFNLNKTLFFMLNFVGVEGVVAAQENDL